MILNASEYNLLDYAERWVNDGSPSGFGVEKQLSDSTNPFGLSPYFCPYEVVFPSPRDDIEVIRSNIFDHPSITSRFLIHPDMGERWRQLGFEVRLADDLHLVPTSSGRTSRVSTTEHLCYLKFDFDSVLGRVNRAITYTKALASIEMSDELSLLVSSDFKHKVSIFPEYEVLVARPRAIPGLSAGMLSRSGTPHGTISCDAVARLVPLFSLWSIDRLQPTRAFALDEVFEGNALAMSIALAEIARDMVHFYFSCLAQRGLQVELNAQNILVAIGKDGNYLGCCVRDFSSTEKDLPIRRELGLSCEFSSSPYKVLDRVDDAYFIRHSFAYDFKLTTYVVLPCLSALKMLGEIDPASIRDSLISDARDWISRLPTKIFPEKPVWYRHPKILLTEARFYEECDFPQLR